MDIPRGPKVNPMGNHRGKTLIAQPFMVNIGAI